MKERITNINPILDLLKSNSREDFELGVNILKMNKIRLNASDIEKLNDNSTELWFYISKVDGEIKRNGNKN